MNRIFRLTSITAVMILCATPTLLAQEVNGKFALPFQATWGSVVLQPGSYTFMLDANNRGILAIRRDGHTDYVKLGYVDLVKMDGRPSELVTVAYNQKPVVSELYVAGMKASFHFDVPLKYRVSHTPPTVISKSATPEVFARVPVEIMGK